MKGTFTMSYRPQSNGLYERMNQTIKNIIKCTVREKQNTWDMSLDIVMMAFRATPQTSIEFTPNILVTSKEKNMPCDWSMPISMQGNVWEKLLSDKNFIMSGILPYVILRKETG